MWDQHDYIFRVENRPQTVNVEWRIKNNFCQQHTKYIDSPPFKVFGIDAEWNMRFYPNSPLFPLYLVKKPSRSAVRASFIHGVKRADGSPFRGYKHEYLFKSDGDQCGGQCFLSPAEQLEVMAPHNTLTLFCTVTILEYESTLAAVKEGSAPETTSTDGVKALSRNLKELYISGWQNDIKINVKGKSFVAHRSVLIAQSPVFRAMFEHSTAEKKEGEINIDDCNPDSFNDFLLYVYSGDPDIISANNAMDLYVTADKYDLPELKKACSKCLAGSMSTELIFDVVPFATVYGETELLKTATEYFLENAQEVVESPMWQSFIVNHFPLANELLKKMTNLYKKQRIIHL